MSDPRDDLRWEEAQELAEGDEITARLGLSPDPIQPRSEVRHQVMERIAGADLPRRRPERRRWLSVAAGAAAAGIAWALTYAWMSAPPPPPPELEVAIAAAAAADERARGLQEMLGEQDSELETLEGDLREARDALSVLVADRVERLVLSTTSDLETSARVYWDWDEYSCYFVAEGLPAPAPGRAYVLWLYTDEGETLRAGSFGATEGATASFFAMLPKEMGHVVRAVVTDETDPPGEAPAGTAVLAGRSSGPLVRSSGGG